MPLTERDRERYARQLDIEGWGAGGQERLRSSTAFVAGAGGLGSSTSIYLAAAGVGRIIICDHDTVTRTNLNRQILYTPDDIGKDKAFAAAERLSDFNPDIQIEAVRGELRPDTAGRIIEGADIVLDCLDNAVSRKTLNRAAIADRIPMVYATVTEFTGYLSFFYPPTTPCLECVVPECAFSERPQVPGFTAGLIGSIEAMEAVKFLTGIGGNIAGRMLVVEAAEPRFELVEIERDPSCPACGALTP